MKDTRPSTALTQKRLINNENAGLYSISGLAVDQPPENGFDIEGIRADSHGLSRLPEQLRANAIAHTDSFSVALERGTLDFTFFTYDESFVFASFLEKIKTCREQYTVDKRLIEWDVTNQIRNLNPKTSLAEVLFSEIEATKDSRVSSDTVRALPLNFFAGAQHLDLNLADREIGWTYEAELAPLPECDYDAASNTFSPIVTDTFGSNRNMDVLHKLWWIEQSGVFNVKSLLDISSLKSDNEKLSADEVKRLKQQRRLVPWIASNGRLLLLLLEYHVALSLRPEFAKFIDDKSEDVWTDRRVFPESLQAMFDCFNLPKLAVEGFTEWAAEHNRKFCGQSGRTIMLPDCFWKKYPEVRGYGSDIDIYDIANGFFLNGMDPANPKIPDGSSGYPDLRAAFEPDSHLLDFRYLLLAQYQRWVQNIAVRALATLPSLETASYKMWFTAGLRSLPKAPSISARENQFDYPLIVNTDGVYTDVNIDDLSVPYAMFSDTSIARQDKNLGTIVHEPRGRSAQKGAIGLLPNMLMSARSVAALKFRFRIVADDYNRDLPAYSEHSAAFLSLTKPPHRTTPFDDYEFNADVFKAYNRRSIMNFPALLVDGKPPRSDQELYSSFYFVATDYGFSYVPPKITVKYAYLFDASGIPLVPNMAMVETFWLALDNGSAHNYLVDDARYHDRDLIDYKRDPKTYRKWVEWSPCYIFRSGGPAAGRVEKFRSQLPSIRQ